MTQAGTEEQYRGMLEWMANTANVQWSQSEEDWEAYAPQFASQNQVAGEALWEQGLLPYMNSLDSEETRRHALGDAARDETTYHALHLWMQANPGVLDGAQHGYDHGMDASYADASHGDDGTHAQPAQDDPAQNAPKVVKFIGGIGGAVVKPGGGNIDLDQFLGDLANFGLTYTEADLQPAVDAFRQSGVTKEGNTPAADIWGSVLQCSYWQGDGANGYQKVWTVAFVADDGVVDQRNEACVNGLRADGDVCYYTQVGNATLLDASGFDPLFGLARYCSWLQGSGEFGTITRTNKTLGRNTLVVSSTGALDQGAMKATLRKFTDKAVDFA